MDVLKLVILCLFITLLSGYSPDTILYAVPFRDAIEDDSDGAVEKYSWSHENSFMLDNEIDDTAVSGSNTEQPDSPKSAAYTAASLSERKLKNNEKKMIQASKVSNNRSNGQTKTIQRGEKYSSYRVKKKDTLYRISKQFQIPLPELCKANSLSKESTIRTGMILVIPGSRNKSSQIKSCAGSFKLMYSIQAREDNPRFIWPISHVLDYKKDEFNGVKSIGITITGKSGSQVIASAKGIVKRIGHMRGYGNYIVISHRKRFATVYANLESICVSEGEEIQTGGIIGRINKESKDIHFQIDHAGKPKNPLRYLPKRG